MMMLFPMILSFQLIAQRMNCINQKRSLLTEWQSIVFEKLVLQLDFATSININAFSFCCCCCCYAIVAIAVSVVSSVNIINVIFWMQNCHVSMREIQSLCNRRGNISRYYYQYYHRIMNIIANSSTHTHRQNYFASYYS